MGKRLKIPVWMLLPETAEMKIVERAHLSREALLRLLSLLDTRLGVEDRGHDNLATVVDGCNGGHRAATAISGAVPKPRGVDRRDGANRTGQSNGPRPDSGLSSQRRENR